MIKTKTLEKKIGQLLEEYTKDTGLGVKLIKLMSVVDITKSKPLDYYVQIKIVNP